ncbi:MAG: hypothetical protein HRT65_14225 [Flavobacteriaceae bacterium]|nr:hypothetical protein [Flavobacteriaceae bacterium]
MFCHHCGFETEEAICPNCGTVIVRPESKIITAWRHETNIAKVARHTDILDYIHTYAKRSNERIDSQYILDKLDLVFGTFTGLSTNLIMEIAVPIYSKLGVKTAKRKTATFDLPMNEVFVRVLCAISANKKLDFNEFHQAKDGILIVGDLKPDLLSFKGTLVITLTQQKERVQAEFNAVIKGQLYDYGKNDRIISKLLADIKSVQLNE